MIDKETAIALANEAGFMVAWLAKDAEGAAMFQHLCNLAVAHAQKDAVHQTDWTGTPEGWTSSPAPSQKDAELRREPTAVVCDCERATDDDGRLLHYALLYLDHPPLPGTELYTKKETK